MEIESKKADMKNRMPYSVPEGYFDNLHGRLESVRDSAPGRPGWMPAFAMAALAAVVVTAGLLFLRRPSVETLAVAENQAYEDVIVDYLIGCGASADYIDYVTNY